jgi:hypothetical protein
MISSRDNTVYHATRRAGEPLAAEESATPPGEVQAGMDRIIEAWNRCIPKGRVRIVALYRRYALRALLHTFTADQVIEAIQFYGMQAYQRQKGAWKTFDNFMCDQVVTTWIEAAEEAAEAAEAAEDRKRRAARQKADAADAQAAEDAAWKAMTKEAVGALVEEVRRRMPAALLTNPTRVLAYARELWRTQRAPGAAEKGAAGGET